MFEVSSMKYLYVYIYFFRDSTILHTTILVRLLFHPPYTLYLSRYLIIPPLVLYSTYSLYGLYFYGDGAQRTVPQIRKNVRLEIVYQILGIVFQEW